MIPFYSFCAAQDNVQAAAARIDILQNSEDKNFIIKLTQCRFKLLAWECCKVKWCPGQGVGGGGGVRPKLTSPSPSRVT